MRLRQRKTSNRFSIFARVLSPSIIGSVRSVGNGYLPRWPEGTDSGPRGLLFVAEPTPYGQQMGGVGAAEVRTGTEAILDVARSTFKDHRAGGITDGLSIQEGWRTGP